MKGASHVCWRIVGQPEVGRKRGSRDVTCHFKPMQRKFAFMLGASPPMNPFFYSEEAGAKGLLGCTLGVRHEVKGVVPFAEKSLYGTVGC